MAITTIIITTTTIIKARTPATRAVEEDFSQMIFALFMAVTSGKTASITSMEQSSNLPEEWRWRQI